MSGLEIKKRNRFAFDPLSSVVGCVRQSPRGGDMNSAAEQVLEVALQGRLLEQAPPGAHVDEQVQVAF